jgi:hypothetical protein
MRHKREKVNRAGSMGMRQITMRKRIILKGKG